MSPFRDAAKNIEHFPKFPKYDAKHWATKLRIPKVCYKYCVIHRFYELLLCFFVPKFSFDSLNDKEYIKILD